MTPEEVRRLIDRLEGEVNNGGFNQFFFNSSGNDAAATILALETVGAWNTAGIMRSACERFLGGTPPSDWTTRQLVLEEVDPEVETFEPEDAAFLAYEEDLSGLVAAYEARFRSGWLFRWLPLGMRRR